MTKTKCPTCGKMFKCVEAHHLVKHHNFIPSQPVHRAAVTKEDAKRIMDEVDELDLPDGAHWALVHERLGLEYGDVFDIIAADPEFFGATSLTSQQGNSK